MFLFKTKGWESPLKKQVATDEKAYAVQYKQGFVDIKFNEAYSGNVSLQLYNVSGQLLQSEQKQLVGRFISFQLPALAQGVYVVATQTEQGSQVVKFVKSAIFE
ncbi:T9SS type A sorting domain-containing protein [bacterium]|nr:T9SS type A sorting domain-containing protein [bacterium]